MVVHWWLVTPSPMEFENIGFSRPVARDNTGIRTPVPAPTACLISPDNFAESDQITRLRRLRNRPARLV